MVSAVITFGHQPGGTPLTSILGVSVIDRAVLEVQRAGISKVTVLVHAADVASCWQTLELNRHITVQWTVVDHGVVSPGQYTNNVWIDGAVLFRAKAISALLTATEAHTSPLGLLYRGTIGPAWWLRDSATPVTFPMGRPPENASYVTLEREEFALSTSMGDAENFLIRGLTKDADGLVSRHLNRKISTAISRRIAHLPIHPNAVTAVVALIGVSSWPLGWMGSYVGFAAAGFSYWFSAVLDGVDGELSRLKYLGSPLGAWLDTLTDDTVGTAYLIGLFGGLAAIQPDSYWVEMGWFTVLAFWATVIPRYWLMVTKVGAGDHQKISATRAAEAQTSFARIVDAVAKTVFRTDFLPFFGMVTAILGFPQVFAWSFAIGTIPAVIETAVTLRRWL